MTWTLESDDIIYRPMEYGDEGAVFDIFEDWDHDGKRFTPDRSYKAVHKWVHDATQRPVVRAMTGDTTYREAIIGHDIATGDPLVIDAYLARGFNDPKNTERLNFLWTEVFAIHPDYRAANRVYGIINTLMRFAFENLVADVVVMSMPESTQARTIIDDRYTDTITVPHRRGARINTTYTKAEHDTRMIAFPAEAATKHLWTDL